jgi:hypothetical protein
VEQMEKSGEMATILKKYEATPWYK